MADIIQLLPDSVANQIAAGEVVQRPASVVKELVENSIDSESTIIRIIVRDAGKNLVQVIDNGKGMSETDARLSFERHATSKIRNADDLFAIRTMGFRGEALASVAAISEVEMQTRRPEDEIGTIVEIKGSEFVRQEPVACKAGCNLSIKNLFFNVPARRKFLKTNSTELKHIINEIQRVALAHPQIEFSFQNDETEILHLPAASLRQRIMHVFGKNINQQLVEINTTTSMVIITGFIAKPEYAKKSPGEQFFFVNRRFMRHPYFHKAVSQAFEKIIAPDAFPSYFIYFDTDPQSVDVNIHPTKTEIKFENERDIWQILMASVREALGKFNIVPSIDFNTEGRIDLHIPRQGKDPISPEIPVNPAFNPFERENGQAPYRRGSSSGNHKFGNWEEIYKGFNSQKESNFTDPGEKSSLDPSGEKRTGVSMPSLLQIRNKYILSPVKSGLMIIDQKRAHERILYEKFIKTIQSGTFIAQQQLYPVSIELSASDYILIKELTDELANFGFDIRDFGINSILISGCPVDTVNADPAKMIETLISEYKSSGSAFKESPREKIAANLARSSAINYGRSLSREEMQEIIDKLFACRMPNYSPDGKAIITIIGDDEIEKKFRHA
jgi:DNA mismatch repair protein MutL